MKNRGLGNILLGISLLFSTGAYAANTKPTVIPQAVDVNEDESIAITLEGLDVDSDPLTYKIVSKPTKGLVVLPVGSNTATYTPKANYSGSDKFTFTASDGKSTSTAATVSIMVKAVNDPPLATGQSVKLTEDAKGVSITLKATDPDGKISGYTVTVPPAHGSYTQSNVGTQIGAKITYKPVANYSGADSFTFTASDGSLSSAPATINLSVIAVNDKPVADSKTVTVGSSGMTTITLSGSDADGNALTYALSTSPKPKGTLSAIFNGNQVNYTPKAGVTSDSFKFMVKDGKLTSALATITVKVEDVPVISITDPFLLQCFGGVAPSTAALTALATLSCDGVDLSVANLAQLAQLPSLRTLDLSHTKLTNISGLDGLTQLTSLNLEFNEITDLTPLAGMTGLTFLNLGFNEIENIGVLTNNMSGLTELYLDANKISSIGSGSTGPLAGKTLLTKLALDDNQISDISVLNGLSSLTHVGLGYNKVSDVTALAGKSLQVLVLDANYLNSLSSLPKPSTLQELYLRGNGPTDSNVLTDVSPLENFLPNLRVLELGFNHISDASPLRTLTNLTRLGLEYNNLSNVSTLSGLTKLNNLDLEHNQLVTSNGIPSMAALNGLLRLEGNSLLDDDLTALAAMSNSYSLRLEDNCLSNFPFNPSKVKVYGEDWQFPAARCGGTTPVAQAAAINIVQGTGAATITLNASDPNGDSNALTYKLESIELVAGSGELKHNGNTAVLGNLSGNQLEFVPNPGHLKSAGRFTFSVTDADAEKSQTVAVTLRVVHPLLVTCFGNAIPDDDALAQEPRLDQCAGKNLTDISILPTYFPNLTTLFLGGNAITNYAPLQQLTKLTGLSLKGNDLDTVALTLLGSLHEMRILELDECQLNNTDIGHLSDLTKLFHLVLNDNDITDISSLSGLTGLFVLKLGDSPTVVGNNAITDLDPIKNMTGLQTLILGGNNIGDNQAANLDVLDGLGNLVSLDLDDNGLTGVGGLASLPTLDVLTLRYNRLSPTTVDTFKAYPNGLALYLQQNCLNSTDVKSGWPAYITIDTSGNQCSLVDGQCPPYFGTPSRSCAALP